MIKSVALVVLSVVLVAILFGGVRVALRILHLKRFMSGEHFAEAAALFSRIEDRAVRMIDEPTPWERGSADPFSDPRFAISKHGLVIQYTCVSSDDVAHHVSTSDGGGRLTYSAAGRLGYLFLHQLGVDLSRVAVSRSEAGIFHLDFELSESEHEALAARSLLVPKADEVMRLTDPGSEWMASLFQADSIDAVPTVESEAPCP